MRFYPLKISINDVVNASRANLEWTNRELERQRDSLRAINLELARHLDWLCCACEAFAPNIKTDEARAALAKTTSQ